MQALSAPAPTRPTLLRPRRYGSCMAAHAHQPALPEPSAAVQSAASAQLNSHPSQRVGADVRAAALHDGTAALSFSPGHATADAFEPVCVDAAVPRATTASTAPARSVRQTIAEILALSLPALGSTLADPVCSLVDTALVGQVSSLQLAALSPCTAIFNLAFLVRFSACALLSRCQPWFRERAMPVGANSFRRLLSIGLAPTAPLHRGPPVCIVAARLSHTYSTRAALAALSSCAVCCATGTCRSLHADPARAPMRVRARCRCAVGFVCRDHAIVAWRRVRVRCVARMRDI